MANNEEHQVREAIEAIHLPDDIAARALASIEAKRKQQENERTEGLLTAATQSRHQKDRGAPLPRNAARPCISPKAGASPRLQRAWRLSRVSSAAWPISYDPWRMWEST